MPLIDARCLTCGEVREQYRSLAMFPATHPCPNCGGATEQIHLPKRTQWSVGPVIVFKAPDGTFRFPGDPSGLSAANYAKQGYERVEIRGALEMRAFESRMNKVEYSKAARQAESKQAQREAREKELRGALRMKMQSMSTMGRAVARAAMERNDGKPRERANDAGFVSEVYSVDRSNRDDSRDERGKRRHD